jgi:tryptophan synthase
VLVCTAGNFTTQLLKNTQLRFVDIIELGMPFTDPIADGPTIQTANTVR